MPRRTKVADWRNSAAKGLLRNDIISGAVLPNDKANDVWLMHPEYSAYHPRNFATNLRNLRNVISRDAARADTDYEAYKHDRAIVQSSIVISVPVWHRSLAAKLLKQDIKDKKHINVKPAELYKSRVEYQCFSQKTFRNHIYQEKKRQEKSETVKNGTHPRYAKLKVREAVRAIYNESN